MASFSEYRYLITLNSRITFEIYTDTPTVLVAVDETCVIYSIVRALNDVTDLIVYCGGSMYVYLK
jgi:hypothetical protein